MKCIKLSEQEKLFLTDENDKCIVRLASSLKDESKNCKNFNYSFMTHTIPDYYHNDNKILDWALSSNPRLDDDNNYYINIQTDVDESKKVLVKCPYGDIGNVIIQDNNKFEITKINLGRLTNSFISYEFYKSYGDDCIKKWNKKNRVYKFKDSPFVWMIYLKYVD